MAGDRSVVTRFRVEYNQAVQGMDAIAGSAQKTSREVEKAGTALEQASRKQSDAVGKLRVAETQLDEAKRKNVEGSSRVIASEEKVARARREVETTTEQATQAQRGYEAALKSQQAQQDKMAQSSSTAFEKMAKNAKANEQAWNNVGGTLVKSGGVVAGLGTAALASGVQFNSLKQTATAALSSVMGSAQGAALQMKRMNAFGRETWVMRDSLIRAQQTMTGFGIETGKVVGYMDSLAETVAATTGSNQDFEDLARVMGKVESEGKITAKTFREFGTRGVDAAQLIGEEMGYTAGEIREQVTAGTLDAGEALDALAAGMKTRFDGATENLRDTFSGAIANVQGAWRDLSATLAEPLVSEAGGGLFVSGLNSLADTLYGLQDSVEALPQPMLIAAEAMTAAGAAAGLGAGGFLLFVPRILETRNALETLAGQDDLVGKFARGMQKVGPSVVQAAVALGVATVAWNALDKGIDKVTGARIPDIKKLSDELESLAATSKDASDALSSAFSGGSSNKLTQVLTGTEHDVNNLNDAFEELSTHDNFLGPVLLGLQNLTPGTQALERATEGVKAYDEAFVELVEAGTPEKAAAAFDKVSESLLDQGYDIDFIVDQFGGYKDILEETADALDVAGLSNEEYAAWMRGELPPAILEAADANREYADTLAGIPAEAENAADGIGTMSESAVEAQEQLDELYDKVADNSRGFVDFAEKATDADVSMQDWIRSMEDQVKAQEEWHENLQILIDRGAPQQLIDQLMELGPEGAFRTQQLAESSEEWLGRASDAFTDLDEQIATFAGTVTQIPDINLEADDEQLHEQLWLAKYELEKLGEMETNPTADLQIEVLEEKVRLAEDKLGILDETEAVPLVGVSGADTSRGKIEGVHDALIDVGEEKPVVEVNASTDKAEGVIKTFWNWLTSSQPDPVKNTGKGRKGVQDRAKMLDNPLARATGGSVIGSGTGTSDDILAKLSNGEHVWTSDEVQAAGGQANVYRLRSMVLNGELQELIPGFATGGAVGAAESRLSGAQRELDRLRKSKRSVTPEQARQDAKEAQAQRRIDDAQAALDRARAEQARRERVSAMQIDLSTDIRRGTIRDQVTGGLSGSYSVVDRLMKLAEDENLGRGARNTARSSAGRFEANLRRLHKQAGSVDEKLKQAQEKARELEGISNAVASRLMNDRKVDFSTSIESTGDGNFRQTSRLSGLDSRVSLVKALSDKLGRLAKAGMPGSLLQEIAGLGLEGGNEAADALLGASKTDRASYASAWGDFEHYANLAGANVSSGFYAGGVNAAQGVVKGLESQQRNIENQIAAIAKSMESVFKQVLGIRSPSTVMEAAGRDTGEGARLGLLRSLPGIRDAAGLIAQASMPNFEAMPAPVLNADAAPAKVSIEDMSASTLAGLSEMRQAVSEGFLDMTNTTTESQGVMSESTRMSQEAMTLSTRDSHAQMRNLVDLEQTTMLSTLRDRQASMLESTRIQQNSMLEATRSNFASIRTVGTDETNVLRSNVISTMMGMRSDHQAHLSGMQETNRTGFKEMERSGVEAFMGMRSGIDGEMGGARPELRSNLNDLIDVFDSFTKSVNEAFGDVGVKLSSPTRLYTGGVLPGHTPGRDIHHFRSPSAGDLYLSGGEAIMRPEFTNAVGGEQGVKELNALARGGRIGDMNSMLHTAMYADGGVMPRIKGVTAFADSGVWRSLFGAVKEKFPSVRLHSAYRPGSITATGNRSLHGQGKAVDISPRMDIAEWIRENFGGGTRELIFSPMGNRQINRGKNHYYTGVTRSMHFDHVHWAMDQMLKGVMPFTGDGTYSGGMPTHPFLDKAGVSAGTDLTKSYREAAKKQMATILKKHVGELSGLNPTMGDLGEGIMKSTQEGLVKKAEEHAESMKFVMPGGEGVARWRDTVIQALGYAGLPQTEDYIGAWLRQIQTESGGNPNIMQQIRDVNSGGKEAAGLVQVIPGTFAAFRDKSLPNDRMHPLANLVAGMNWAKYKASRQGRDMLSFIGHGHGYSQGTSGAPPGVALVGEEGPELVELGGGQRIHTNPETRRFLDIQARPEPSAMIDYDRLAQAMIKALPANENGNPLDGAELTLMVDGKQMAAHISSTVSRVAVDAGRSH